MAKLIGLSLILILTPSILALPVTVNCNWGCFKIYQPVCATNGKTYGNMCELLRATCNDNSIKFSHQGRCSEGKPSCQIVACITLYDPVCGTDGKTYGNTCNLGVARCTNPDLEMAYKGKCGSKIGEALF